MASDNVFIKNEHLTVVIKPLGAEIISIKDADDVERLHQPDMVFWNGQAPLLFPWCGKMRDTKFVYEDKEYELRQHGFARDSLFELLEQTEDLAVFSLLSDEKTKEMYPFDFELIVTYKLLGNSIDVSYEVLNDGESNMYFGIGSHESYNCFDGLGEYEIHFEKEEFSKPYICGTGLIPEENITTIDGHTAISLSDDLFENKRTIMCENPESRFVYLVHKKEGKKIRVDFEDFPYLLLWTPPGSQFVCIEPWTTCPDSDSSSYKIDEKKDIVCLEPNGHFEAHHIISIL